MKKVMISIMGLVAILVIGIGCNKSSSNSGTATAAPTVATNVPKRAVTMQLQVQAAYNTTDAKVFFHLSWASDISGRHNDYYVYKSGAWVEDGEAFRGSDENGFTPSHETRGLIMWGGDQFSFANNRLSYRAHSLEKIDIFGVRMGIDTDANGKVYYANDNGVLSLYKDAARTQLIAQAKNIRGTGTYTLSSQNGVDVSANVTISGISREYVDITINAPINTDPTAPGPNFPTAFEKYGCFLACHDTNTFMPNWTRDGVSAEIGMSIPQLAAPQIMDLWHYRGHRSGPAGLCDDQFIDQADRKGDTGTSPYSTNGLTGGNPDFVMDSTTTTSGLFAYKIADREKATLQDYFMTDATLAGFPRTMTYAAAVTAGYVPSEGDVVSRRILRQNTGSRADISAVIGTQKSGYDFTAHRYNVYMARALNTGTPAEDVIFIDNPANLYYCAFAVHKDNSGERDHYIGLPVSFGLNNPNATINAVQIVGAGLTPDFTKTATYPIHIIDLFLPGITTWEYVTSSQVAPLIGQLHGGAFEVQTQSHACLACHVVRKDDPNVGNARGGAWEEKVTRRGGVTDPTPISFDGTIKAVLLNRCGSAACHGSGTTHGQLVDTANSTIVSLIRSNYIDYTTPLNSKLLTQPLTNPHPVGAAGAVLTTADPDYLKLLRWIIFNAPNN